jgi:uncharacterized protein (TIGR01244 family)
MIFRALAKDMLVAGQIAPADVAEAAALGVTTIVNNRPDGEEPGQPEAREIEAAAEAAGLAYCHIPISGGFGRDDVAAMASALAQGKTLAFCKSGTRSTFLWALARSSAGEDGETLAARAAAAGYDLGPIRRYLR